MFTCFKSPTTKPLAILNQQNSVTTNQIADIYADVAAIRADVRDKIDGVRSDIDDIMATQRDLGDNIKKNQDDASIVLRSFRCKQDSMLAAITHRQDEQRTGLDVVNGRQDAMTLQLDSIERKQDEVTRKVNRWNRVMNVTNAHDGRTAGPSGCSSDQPRPPPPTRISSATPPPPMAVWKDGVRKDGRSEQPRPPPPTRPTPPTTPGDPTTEVEYQCGYCSPRTLVDGVVIDESCYQHFVNICERDHRLLCLDKENEQKYNAALGKAMQSLSMTTLETAAGVSTFACLSCSKQVDGTRNAISHAMRHVQKGHLDKLNVDIGAALIREFWK